MFKQTMRTIISVIQTAGLTFSSVSQNEITTAAAEISAQRVMEHWYPMRVSLEFRTNKPPDLADGHPRLLGSLTIIPTDSKTESRVSVTRAVLRDGTRKGQPG